MLGEIEENRSANPKENIKIALTNSLLMISILNDFLDYMSSKNKCLKVNITSFNLLDCLNEIVQLFTHQILQKKLYLEIPQKDFIKNIQIETDKSRFKQVLINLISNSIKYTYEGGVIISV